MKKKINTLWWFMFVILYLEVIYKEFAFHNLISFSTVYMIPFSLLFIAFFAFITSIFKNEKVNKGITIFITVVFSLYYCAQFIYYNFYKAMISLYSMRMGTVQIFGWIDQILLVILRNIVQVILFLLPIILLLVLMNKIMSFKRNNINRNLFYAFIFISGLALCGLSLLPNKKYYYSNYNLLFNVHYPTLMVNRVGLATTATIDAYRCITDFKENYVLKTSNKSNNYSSDEYNIIDIDFNELLKNEKNSEIKEMHKYFMSKIPTNKNDYTGIFKGKNLVFINAESFDTLAIDEKLTPTLYKLKNEGFVFDNYYVPIFPVSTADGEYMNSTSLIPKEGVWSIYESSKISLPFALGNTFKKLDYNTYSYHNHTYNFYNRNLIYPNYGFQSYLACGNGFEEVIDCTLWPESDEELFKSSVTNYTGKHNFVAYYMTVSGHLRYTPNNDMSKKNWNKVKDTDYTKSYKSYLAQSIELEKGVSYLIETLEEKGLLDNTVIVIAPDHYPYGFTDKQISDLDNSRNNKFELFKSSLIIWNNQTKSEHISKITSSIDIIPTLYNLFGINYDSRLFMGKDIFSDSEGIFILADRSFKTDKVTYDALKNRVTYNSKKDKNYLELTRQDVYSRFTMSSKVLEFDYYDKLAKYLD